MNLALESPRRDSLGPILRLLAVELWREWPNDMEVITFDGMEGTRYRLRGTCPHCRYPSGFMHAGNSIGLHSFQVPIDSWDKIKRALDHAIMQCQACGKFILAVVRSETEETPANHGSPARRTSTFTYVEHYPTGTPDDSVPDEVPTAIAADFKEALRCQWVKAHNATVEMCRRVIEASCIALGANPKLPIGKKIDWVYKQRRINKTLKTVAHQIRLGGNLGAHPSPDPADAITADEADQVVEYTRHYLDHVYVVDQRLGKHTFKKADRKAAKASQARIAPPPGSGAP